MAVILVVEDDPSAQLLTKVKLKNHFTVVCANDGEEALTIMEQQRVDLIVADIMMPNMDGYQLVQSLREVKEEVPIILVTARADLKINDAVSHWELMIIWSNPSIMRNYFGE